MEGRPTNPSSQTISAITATGWGHIKSQCHQYNQTDDKAEEEETDGTPTEASMGVTLDGAVAVLLSKSRKIINGMKKVMTPINISRETISGEAK